MPGHSTANGDALCGTEEAGDDAHRGQNGIEAVDAVNEQEQKAQASADEVA